MATPQPRPPEAIPKKIYYSISEVSEYTGVEPHVLRYWETKFTRLSPKRVGGNQRKYTRNDLDLLYEIIYLLYHEGYTLDGAEKKLCAGLAAVRAERKAEEAAATTRADKQAPPTTGSSDPGKPSKELVDSSDVTPAAPLKHHGIPRDEIRLLRNEIADILKGL